MTSVRFSTGVIYLQKRSKGLSMSDRQRVTQTRVKLTSNDYQKRKPRFLHHEIYAGLNFGSLAQIQFYGRLWANFFALSPAGKDNSTTRQHWLEPVTEITFRYLCSSWVNDVGQHLQTAPLPHLSDDTHKTEFNSPKLALVHAPSTPHSSKPLQNWKPNLGISFLLFDPTLFCDRQNGPWFKWLKVDATSIMNKSQETK